MRLSRSAGAGGPEVSSIGALFSLVLGDSIEKSSKALNACVC